MINKRPLQRLSTKIDKYVVGNLNKSIVRKSTNKIVDIFQNLSIKDSNKVVDKNQGKKHLFWLRKLLIFPWIK